MSYASRGQPPRTLTSAEQTALLSATGEHARGYRDHIIYALALGTGLREAELVALDVGDVFNVRRRARRRITLRIFKGSQRNSAPQEVFVSDSLAHKVTRFAKWKRTRGESLELEAPVFVARGGRRLSTRRVREAFGGWRELAGICPSLSFHSLRHTFCQRLYDLTGDIRLVQVAARHRDISTTTVYAGPSSDKLISSLEKLNG